MTDLASVLDLHPLGEEPWGDRLARAREGAGLTLAGVQHILGSAHITKSTLSRMESFTEAPTFAKDRARALMVLVLYGVDPASFGLGPDDKPAAIDLRAVRDLAGPSSGWVTGDDQRTPTSGWVTEADQAA